MNSKQKGNRGEREAAEALRKHLGIECRRGQQFCGTPDSPDLVHSLPGTHFEVKRTERLNLREATKQAEAECGGKVPIVLHRWNHGEWFTIVPLERLDELARILAQRQGRASA